MKSQRILLLSLLAFCGSALTAQVAAPDFICVTTDSLRWNNVPNACGPYLGTQIFSATDMAGPYSLLTELTDPSAGVFFDNNPSGEQRFYYLQYNYDCPGETVLTSDTLDNRIPIGAQVQSVSIEGDDIIVNWIGSPSPEVNAYIIYRQEATGFQPIDTVSASFFTYVDVGRAAIDPDQTYSVTSLDACFNNSLFGAQVNTLLLSASGGQACESTITLTSPSFASTNMLPISELILLVSSDGCMTFTEVGSFPPDATSFPFDTANDGENLCFALEGVAANGNGRARSQTVVVQVDIQQPIRTFPILAASYDDGGQLSLTFDWDANALVNSLTLNQIVVSTGANTPTDIDWMSLSDLRAQYRLTAMEAGLEQLSLFFRADDACTNLVQTNTIRPIRLNATGNNGTNQLDWTAFSAEINGPITYSLIRRDGAGVETTIFSGSELSATDQIDPNDVAAFRSCYYLVATYQINGEDFSSRSNLACLEQLPGVYLPNVFSPLATQIINREFCPQFSRLPTGDYQLDIWDRWGGHVFSSSNPNDCWDGMDSGRPASSGVYLYRMRLDLGGEIVEQVADVTLLR
ncbi:MAG: gliding motility-associated C-terminal domain-containing protein [Bacteroidota bacterium]